MSNLKAVIGDEYNRRLRQIEGENYKTLDDILLESDSTLPITGRGLAHKNVCPVIRLDSEFKEEADAQSASEFHQVSSSTRAAADNSLLVPGETQQQQQQLKESSCGSSLSEHSHETTHKSRHSRKCENNNKENILEIDIASDREGRLHRHHHRQHNHHHHHHHHHHSSHHHKHNKSTENGESVDPATEDGATTGRPGQVLRKYIIKKITIRKQDGSTKKIVIKKPVDEPNAPVKLSKVEENVLLSVWVDSFG